MTDFELHVEERPTPVKAPEAIAKEEETSSEFPEEELFKVFDEILFSNGYEEEVQVNKRLSVKFRTRTSKEIQAISRIIDASQAVLVSTMEQQRGLLHLQYALVAYYGTDLSTKSESDKAVFIEKLPGAVVASLLEALSKFDRKVTLACRIGEANF